MTYTITYTIHEMYIIITYQNTKQPESMIVTKLESKRSIILLIQNIVQI